MRAEERQAWSATALGASYQLTWSALFVDTFCGKQKQIPILFKSVIWGFLFGVTELAPH